MANGQTVITYGSLRLMRCHTLEFRQEPIYDDSGTDLMYFRYVVRVAGYIHGMTGWCQLQTPFNPIAGKTGSAAQNFIGLRVALQPRQTFSMRTGADASGTSGGYLLLYAEQFPDTNPYGVTHFDVNNGPRGSFEIKRVVADNVFQVEAEFEVCKVECSTEELPSPGGSGSSASGSGSVTTAGTAPAKANGVLSHRWSCSDEIDVNLRTTRVYHGRLRVASNRVNPSQFRYYAVPPLAEGMHRESISFSHSPDGLNLDYLIRDVEMVTACPAPAKNWSIQHTETIDEALTVHASCDVNLSADRLTNVADLIAIGMNVLIAKLLLGDPNAKGSVFIEYLSITDFVGPEKRVNVSGRVRRLPAKDVLNADVKKVFQPWFLANKNFGKTMTKAEVYRLEPEGMDANYTPDRSFGGLDGSAGNNIAGTSPVYQGPVPLVGMFLPYLQSPCNDIHKIVPDGYALSSNSNGTPNATPLPTVAVAEDPDWTDDDRDLYAAAEAEAMYLFYKVESMYDEAEMALALPIANSGYSSGTASMKVVTMSQPQGRRIVRIEAERVGNWPQLPSGAQLGGIVGQSSGSSGSSGSTTLTQTFLKKKSRYATPFYNAGGQQIFRAAADYYFALNRRPEPSEALAVGRSIWTTDGDIATNTNATAGWI